MRLHKIFLYLFSLILITACTKKEKEENPYARYDSTLSATRNGEPVKYMLGAFYDSTGSKKHVTLLIADYRDGRIWDHVIIGNIPSINGHYTMVHYWDWADKKPEATILPFIGYNCSFNSGLTDVSTYYYLGTEPSAAINVISYNEATNEIKGDLQMALRLVPTGPGHPGKQIDSAIYRNATFSVKIHDRAYFGY